MAFIWPTKMAARVGASAASSARPLWRSSVQLSEVGGGGAFRNPSNITVLTL